MNNARLSDVVKSSLSKTVKWRQKRDDPDHFCIKVPASPETQPIYRWLMGVKEPMAVYFKQGLPVAHQWRFHINDMRPLWLAKSPTLDEG